MFKRIHFLLQGKVYDAANIREALTEAPLIVCQLQGMQHQGGGKGGCPKAKSPSVQHSLPPTSACPLRGQRQPSCQTTHDNSKQLAHQAEGTHSD